MDVWRYFAALWQLVRSGVLSTVGIIGIADIVDILIIAFVVYKLLQFLRRSRLGLIARSIVFLAITVWLSGQLGLMVVNFATRSAIQIGILALVILFQPEIRQYLERIGRTNFIGLFTKEATADEVDSVVLQTALACQRIAEEEEGALIVFERQVSLEEEIETGTRLDALNSAELLQNIFFDKSPLHDGAVIIRGGRIASAGCMLPLSDNANLSRNLGMRHRAGIGVSEKSDAVAVIVSEENGAISVAIEGRLRRHITMEAFEKLLLSELAERNTKGGGTIWSILKGKRHEKNSQ